MDRKVRPPPPRSEYPDSLRLRLSARWWIDEMHVAIGGKGMYIYALIDDEGWF